MAGQAQDSIVLGSPSVLSSWVFELLREVCAQIPERASTRLVDRNDLVETPSGETAPSFVYLSQFPSPSLLAKCGEGAAPILLLLDDPVDAVRYLRRVSRCSVVEALRLQTAATASYAQLRGHNRMLIFHRLAKLPTRDIIELILNHLGLELSARERDALSQNRVGSDGPDAGLESSLQACVDGYERLEDARARFTTKENATIGGVLGPLIQMSFRDSAENIIWPIETFLSGDRPDTPASLVADLTGGARILYYGPYFYLPSGSWKVRMTVGFSAGALRTPFSVEVYGGRLLAHATMVPEAKGVFHASFDLVHGDALQPVEVRLRTDRGAIEGRVALGNVEFSRRQEPEAGAASKVESVR
jgi:hypothetical protein